MKPCIRQKLAQSLTHSLMLYTRLENYWDWKLTKNPGNPWPLAPRDLVKMGFVTDENYAAQNQAFSSACSRNALTELMILGDELKPADYEQHILEIDGYGLGRGLRSIISFANTKKIRVVIYEASKVGCHKAEHLLAEIALNRSNSVSNVAQHAEVLTLWEQGEIDSRSTIAIYANGFIGVQSNKRRKKILRHWGEFLKLPGRRIFLVHPEQKFNPAPGEKSDAVVEWAGIRLTGVKWGDMKPLNIIEEVLPDIEEALGGSVAVLRPSTCKYYHQTWTMTCLMEARQLL
jgi:hypothetical protein